MMSFAGELPDTRLGHKTIVRLCAFIKFVDECKDTSCIKSAIIGRHAYSGLEVGRTKDVAEQYVMASRQGWEQCLPNVHNGGPIAGVFCWCGALLNHWV